MPLHNICHHCIVAGDQAVHEPFHSLHRYPTLPVAELQRHQAPVNALAWAPHSSCHICSAGDDAQALIWDLSTMSHPMDHGLGAILWLEALHVESVLILGFQAHLQVSRLVSWWEWC